MKKQLLITLITIISYNCIAQISFQEGYIINNSGDKINCYIKNIDWKDNPTEFSYKITENSEPQLATIQSVEEFVISSHSTYKRFLVDIDRSSLQVDKLSQNKNSIFEQETLFLKLLVSGDGNLYGYSDGNLTRFFFKLENSDIIPLIYKNYKTAKNKIGENIRFKQQLWNKLKCKDITINDAQKTNYNKNDLVNFFVKYNTCKNPNYMTGYKKEKRKPFNLNVKAGADFASMSINNGLDAGGLEFDGEINFRLGIEAEYILPFNSNKWALFLESFFRSYKNEIDYTIVSPITLNIDYKSVEVGIGLRHYFFLNNSSKIFINGSMLLDFPVNPEIIYYMNRPINPTLDNIYTTPNFKLGIGYQHLNKYSIALNLGLDRELEGFSRIPQTYILDWQSNYSTISFVFGYTIF